MLDFKKNFDTNKLLKDAGLGPDGNMRLKLYRAMQEEVAEIVKRTQSGRTIEGAGFKEYTPEYAAWKSGFTTSGARRHTRIKSGKRAGKMRVVRTNLGAGGAVNLTLSGDMLRSIQSSGALKTKWENNCAIGTITVPADQAPKVIGNQKKRPFFGLSKQQIERIKQAIGRK